MELKVSIIERFTKRLTFEGKATATIANYINDVKQFNQYLDVKDVDHEVLITRFLFTNFMKQLEAERMAVSNINKKINSLKMYNDWLYHEKMIDDVVSSIKKDKVKIVKQKSVYLQIHR